MKNLRHLPLLCAAVCATLLLLPARELHAQATPTPPGKMSYQGFLTDVNGVPLGNATPINTNIIFRIWKSASGTATTDKLWSELQVVTIDKGYFTVLLGEGSAVSTEASINAANLSGLFIGADASDRFVEMTLVATGSTTGNPITPRTQLLPAPYAMLARSATQLVDPTTGTPVFTSSGLNGVSITGTITGNGNGLTNLNPASLLGGTVANALTFNNAANSFSGNGSGLTALDASKITIGTLAADKIPNLPDTKLSGNVALLNRASQNFSGNLGINNVPSFPLHVRAAVNGWTAVVTDSTGAVQAGFELDSNWAYVGTRSSHDFRIETANSTKMIVTKDGNVGIGTLTPTQAKLVVSGSVRTSFYTYAEGYDSWNDLSDTTKDQDLSIYATQTIAANKFVTGSDARIKNVVEVSSSASDLSVLQKIEVTDYSYRDWRHKGRGLTKKVIAQQVEKVFPQAVSKATDVVPDIYQKATIQDGWVKLVTNLTKGERVRLIGEKEEGIHEVLEVKADGFRTAFNPKGEKVFVYGREVKDFRSVDYEAISMLNVSATQELARQVEALRKSEARVAELEQKAAQSEQKVLLLEQKAARVDAELAELKKLIARVTGPQPEQRPAAEAPASAAGK